MCSSRLSSPSFPAAGDGKRMRGWDAGHVPLVCVQRAFLLEAGVFLRPVEAGPHSAQAEKTVDPGKAGAAPPRPRPVGNAHGTLEWKEVFETPNSVPRQRKQQKSRNASEPFENVLNPVPKKTYEYTPEFGTVPGHTCCSLADHQQQRRSTSKPSGTNNYEWRGHGSHTVLGSRSTKFLFSIYVLFYSYRLSLNELERNPKEPSHRWCVLMCNLGHRQ
jgi:hypothetical protein